MIDKIKEFILKPFCDMTVKEKLLDIFVIISLSLIIVFGFSSCSKLNAEEITYYDWEKVEVSELPESSDSTLDKVYVVNDKYYITNKVSSDNNYTAVPLNQDLNGVNIYLNIYDHSSFCDYINTNISNSSADSITWSSGVNLGFFQYYYINGLPRIAIAGPVYKKFPGPGNSEGYYSGLSSLIDCRSSENYSFEYFRPAYSFIINAYFDDYVYRYFSLTPFVASTISYSWEEVSKDLVDPFDRHLSDDDFYLFFTFEDISNFNIFSSYDFSVFTDFEKIVVVGLFNILYLGLFFGVVYVFIKLLNKGLSFIFK